jgi:hypothetical protein
MAAASHSFLSSLLLTTTSKCFVIVLGYRQSASRSQGMLIALWATLR